MDTTPSPRSSSQGDVEMDDGSATLYDDSNVGYSQAEYGAGPESQDVGSYDMSGSVVPETQSTSQWHGETWDDISLKKGDACEVDILGVNLGVIYYQREFSKGVQGRLWPTDRDERTARIAALAQGDPVRATKLNVRLSCFFDFLRAGCAFPDLHTLVLRIDGVCAGDLALLKRNMELDKQGRYRGVFAPNLKKVVIELYTHGGPDDLVAWALDHGLPLIAVFCKPKDDKEPPPVDEPNAHSYQLDVEFYHWLGEGIRNTLAKFRAKLTEGLMKYKVSYRLTARR